MNNSGAVVVDGSTVEPAGSIVEVVDVKGAERGGSAAAVPVAKSMGGAASCRSSPFQVRFITGV